MVGGGGLTADVRKLRLPDTATRTLGVAAGLACRVALAALAGALQPSGTAVQAAGLYWPLHFHHSQPAVFSSYSDFQPAQFPASFQPAIRTGRGLVGWGDEAGRLALGRAKGLPPLLSEWKTCFDWTFNFSSTNVLAYCCVQNHETDYRMKIRSNMNPSVSDLYIYTMQNNKLKDKYQFKPKKFDSKSIQF